jgi:hypothetical protein
MFIKITLLILSVVVFPMASFADGTIKFKFAPYKYTKDPGGASYNSYNMLGPVYAYIVKIYPAKIMTNVKNGIIGNIIPQCVFTGGEMFVRNSTQLKGSDIKKGIAEWFTKKKSPLSVYFLNPRMNHVYEFPLPNGNYYLQYFLKLKKTRLNSLKSSDGIAGPIYPKNESGGYGEWNSWGKSKVKIYNNKIGVLFEPQDANPSGDNIALYTKYFEYLFKTGKVD